jgi:hypothetical protein
MTLSNQELIQHFYEVETMVDHEESLYSKVTLQGRVEDIAMLNAISERFSTTRFELSKTILRNAVAEMYFNLSDSDKQLLSAKADDEITSHMKKAGFTSFFEYGAAGNFENESGYWRNHYALNKDLTK